METNDGLDGEAIAVGEAGRRRAQQPCTVERWLSEPEGWAPVPAAGAYTLAAEAERWIRASAPGGRWRVVRVYGCAEVVESARSVTWAGEGAR